LATMASTRPWTLGVTARLCYLSHILHHTLLAFAAVPAVANDAPLEACI